mmetsp:Transcript_9380/g.17113  ORF Transcript_9380/g.17113 Transcript_9380/m.17113 type:complete len:230 (-) Transcript_9380:276-965(-)
MRKKKTKNSSKRARSDSSMSSISSRISSRMSSMSAHEQFRERALTSNKFSDRARGHFRFMLDTTTITPSSWRGVKYPSKFGMYALSSFTYCLLGLALLTVFRELKEYNGFIILDGILLMTQSSITYIADVLYFGHNSIWHAVDRSYATFLTTFITLTKILYMDHIEILIGVITLAFGYYCLGKSRLHRSESGANWDEYLYWHTLWHLTCPLGMFVMVARVAAVEASLFG